MYYIGGNIVDLLEIGDKIKKYRKYKKLSQSEVATILKMGRSTISGIENGTINEIGFRKMINLCTLLGLEFEIKEKTRAPTLRELMLEIE